LPTERHGLSFFKASLLWVNRPLLRRVGGGIDRPCIELDTCRIDARSGLPTEFDADADDLGDECTLELCALPPFRTCRVPHAKDESGRRVLVDGRSVIRRGFSECTPHG